MKLTAVNHNFRTPKEPNLNLLTESGRFERLKKWILERDKRNQIPIIFWDDISTPRLHQPNVFIDTGTEIHHITPISYPYLSSNINRASVSIKKPDNSPFDPNTLNSPLNLIAISPDFHCKIHNSDEGHQVVSPFFSDRPFDYRITWNTKFDPSFAMYALFSSVKLLKDIPPLVESALLKYKMNNLGFRTVDNVTHTGEVCLVDWHIDEVITQYQSMLELFPQFSQEYEQLI